VSDAALLVGQLGKTLPLVLLTDRSNTAQEGDGEPGLGYLVSFRQQRVRILVHIQIV